jgi:hypothetical protein
VDPQQAFGKGNAGELVLLLGQKTYLLEDDCYVIDRSWLGRKASLSVNNFIDSPPPLGSGDDQKYEDLGVQVLIVSAPGTIEQGRQAVYAYRANGQLWYRGLSEVGEFASSEKPLALDVDEWSSAHTAGTVLSRNDRALGGPFHAAAKRGGKLTFNEWWRVGTELLRRHDLVLKNYLLRFEAATGDLASGIPFHFKLGTAEEVLVRYASASSSIRNSVRLCIEKCLGPRLGVEMRPSSNFVATLLAMFTTVRADDVSAML